MPHTFANHDCLHLESVISPNVKVSRDTFSSTRVPAYTKKMMLKFVVPPSGNQKNQFTNMPPGRTRTCTQRITCTALMLTNYTTGGNCQETDIY